MLDSPWLLLDNSHGKAQLKVPAGKIGMLIGKGGEIIRFLAKESGARIEVSKETSPDAERMVHITGPPESVEKARRMVEERLNSTKEVSGPDDPDATVISVPPNVIGALLGKGGEHLKRLRQESGARIDVSHRKDDCSVEEHRLVHITGPVECREYAKTLVENLIEKPLREAAPRPFTNGSKATGPDSKLISEKIYVDELDLSYRPDLWHEFEDGIASDIEIFVQGFLPECTERHVWDYLCAVDAKDMREILMPRRHGKSKGVCYVVFQSHKSAVLARKELHGLPAEAIFPPGSLQRMNEVSPRATIDGKLNAWFSESERCIKGQRSVYSLDIVSLLLGQNEQNVEKLENDSSAHKVMVSGTNMKSWGLFDDDPRLHMVVFYEANKENLAEDAARLWQTQLENVHLELAERKTAGELPPPASNDADEVQDSYPLYKGSPQAEQEGSTALVCRGLDVKLVHSDIAEEHVDEVLSGVYEECGENHGRSVYQKRLDPEKEAEREVFIYFWDERDGEEVMGWWFGASVGGEEVWARRTSEDLHPPESGWEIIASNEADVDLMVKSRMLEDRPRRHRHRRKRRHHEASLPQPCPPWTMIPHKGSFYYWNEATGETSWEPPPGSKQLGASGVEDVTNLDGSKRADAESKRHRRRMEGDGGRRRRREDAGPPGSFDGQTAPSPPTLPVRAPGPPAQFPVRAPGPPPQLPVHAPGPTTQVPVRAPGPQTQFPPPPPFMGAPPPSPWMMGTYAPPPWEAWRRPPPPQGNWQQPGEPPPPPPGNQTKMGGERDFSDL